MKNPTIPKKLREFINADNIADSLSDNELNKIALNVIEGVQKDEDSRNEWRQINEASLKLAKQVLEEKSTPWPGAANIKYPLLTQACIQFNSHTNPQIIQNEDVVKVAVMIPDPTDMIYDRGQRLSEHMSYQCLDVIENWRSDTDKLLMVLALMGTVFRKTYFNSIDKIPAVDLCLPDQIVINNNIASLEKAPRITHILYLNKNDIKERMRAGIFTEYSMESLLYEDDDEETIVDYDEDGKQEADCYEIYEQHTWLDLDEDGYKEPYIVSVHKDSNKVLRIVARYNESSFVFHEKTGNFIKINAQNHFTDYHLIPSPEGTFYSLGFGSLLYPLNSAINTVTNQLLDAGTLSNRQSGFISKNARIRKEDTRLKLGEWKMINIAAGETLANSIYPLPTREPSGTLFNLLNFLITAGQSISNVNDIMQGEMPAPNTPASTVMAMVEQGTRVYSAILSRLFVSFKKEFNKLYDLNREYLDKYDNYQRVIKSGIVTLEDYESDDYGVFPVMDPNLSSRMMKMVQAQALLQMIQIPGINQPWVIQQYLQAIGIKDLKEAYRVPPPPQPTPAEQLELEQAMATLAKTKMETADIIMQRDLEALRLEKDTEGKQAQAAYWGGQLTAQKIAAMANYAKTEAEIGAKQMDLAERQAQLLNTNITVPTDEDLSGRVQQMEQTMTNILNSISGNVPQEEQQPEQMASEMPNISPSEPKTSEGNTNSLAGEPPTSPMPEVSPEETEA